MARASSKKPRSSSSKRGSSKSSKKKQAAKNDTKVLRGTLKKSRSKNKRAANRDSKHHKYYHRSSSDDSSDEGGTDLKVKRKKRSKSKQRSRSSSKETKSSMASRHSGYRNNEVRPRPPVVFPTSPPIDHIHEYKDEDKSRRNEEYDKSHYSSDDGTEWLHSDHEDVEVDNYKTQTELAMARMVAGQRESTVIASVAAREAAKLKYEVAKHVETNKALESKIREGLDRERAMTLSRSKDKMEIRELKYRVTYLTKELQIMKDADAKGQSKTKAKIESVVNALSELENFVGARARAVQRDVRHLKALLSSLQRHMSRGFVSSTSQTGQRLITALWKTAESIINSAGPDALPKAGMAQAHVNTFRKTSSSPHSNKKSPLNVREVRGGEEHVDLAETMDGIVADLENENRKLRAELDVCRNEFVVEQQRSKDAALIPQYRNAVRRARGHAESLRQRLATELQEKQKLLQKLHAMEQKWREATMMSTANAERSVLADATAAESHRKLAKHAQELANERAGYQQAYDDLARTAEAQQKLIVELQRIVDEQREQLEVRPLKVTSPEQHSFDGPSAPSHFHGGPPQEFDFGTANAQVISDNAAIADDVVDVHNNFGSGKSAVNSSGLGKLGEQGDSNSSTRVVQQNIDGTKAAGDDHDGASTGAETEFLAQNASTTVAALNNDLQSLDSEIAMLQQNLRRIQMGDSPLPDDLVNDAGGRQNGANDMKLDQEIIL